MAISNEIDAKIAGKYNELTGALEDLSKFENEVNPVIEEYKELISNSESNKIKIAELESNPNNDLDKAQKLAELYLTNSESMKKQQEMEKYLSTKKVELDKILELEANIVEEIQKLKESLNNQNINSEVMTIKVNDIKKEINSKLSSTESNSIINSDKKVIGYIKKQYNSVDGKKVTFEEVPDLLKNIVSESKVENNDKESIESLLNYYENKKEEQNRIENTQLVYNKNNIEVPKEEIKEPVVEQEEKINETVNIQTEPIESPILNNINENTIVDNNVISLPTSTEVISENITNSSEHEKIETEPINNVKIVSYSLNVQKANFKQDKVAKSSKSRIDKILGIFQSHDEKLLNTDESQIMKLAA